MCAYKTVQLCLLFISFVSSLKHMGLITQRFRKMNDLQQPMVPELIASLAFLISPFGNIQEAVKATVADSNAITCTLDPQSSDGTHDSCQLFPNVVRVRAGRILTFRQDWGGSSSTGAAIWNGANIATRYLEESTGAESVKGKTVIELGAGVGYEGIIAHLLGAKEVAITDGSEEVLKLADENIAINCDISKSPVYSGRLRWNTEDEKAFLQNGKTWDIILASDVTYLQKNRADLMNSIVHLSGPQTVTYLSMEPRSVDEVKDTLAEATKAGLIYEETRSLVDADKIGCKLQCARIFALRKAP